MKKYLKLISIVVVLTIIPFFIIPLFEANLLFTLPILLILLYSLFNLYFPFLFLPAILFYKDAIINCLPLLCFSIGLTLVIRIIFNKRKEVLFFHPIIMSGLVNGFYLLINKMFSYELFIYNLLVSLLITSFFAISVKQFKTSDKIIYKVCKPNLLSAVILAFSVFGSLFYENNYFDLDISFIILVLGILYLSYIDSFDLSFVFSIYGMFIYYFYYSLVNVSFFFPLISLIFIKEKKISNLLTVGLLLFELFFLKVIEEEKYLIHLIFCLLGFEIIKLFINLFSYFKKGNDVLPVFNNIISNFNDQIIKFAGFLDEFSRNFVSNSEENIRLNEAFNNLIQTFCFKCPKKSLCFGKDKTNTYHFLKNCLCFGNKIHIKKTSLELKELVKRCYYSNEMIEKANVLKNKYQLFLEHSQKEKILEKQLNGLSNTLRQYVVDLNSKKDMPFEKFREFYNLLKDYGYEIVLYNIRKSFIDDFWIEIGLENVSYKEIEEIIHPIANELFHEVTIELIENKSNSITYFSIIPEIKFRVSYGYASLAKENLNIIGDNYIIKNLGDGNFIAAISDGMGSGYKAYQESKSTIKLIDRVSEFEVNCHTSMNILNTFYSLKDNFDQYATLDYLQINRKNGEAFLYKMGGTNTYIIRNNECITFKNSNLPFGITDLIQHERFNVFKNDLIILMSDGIMDNIKEDSLIDILKYSSHKQPQKVCFDIINHIEKINHQLSDDMSIILLKIE